MYKINFELETILPLRTPNSVITALGIYSKLSSYTSSDVINGFLKLDFMRDDDLSEVYVQLTAFGFFLSINDFTEVQKKLKEVLHKELSGINKNIQIEVKYCKVVELGLFHSLFILLIAKIQSRFRRLKQRFLS